MLKTTKITLNATAINQVARCIWELALETQQRPLVLVSTAGPALALRRELEATRPPNLPPSLAFLPEIHGVNQWLEQTSGLLAIAPKSESLRRWEIVYEALEEWPSLREQLGGIGYGGRWALARAIVLACDKLSASNLSPAYGLMDSSEELLDQAQLLFEEALTQTYPLLAAELVNVDARLVMAFWRNLSSLADPSPRRQLAYELRAKEANCPLVWLELAAPSAFEQRISQHFLSEYVRQQAVSFIEIDWSDSALWPEALPEEIERSDSQLIKKIINANRHKAESTDWEILGLKRFEDVAWMATQKIEDHLSAGRKNIALIAQDRLVARRVRALLARYGPGLSVQDETGWKLVTTRVAAAVHSWLSIVRSGNGPSVMDLMAFLKSPIFDVAYFEASKASDPSAGATINRLSYSRDLLWEIEKRLLTRDVKAGWTSIIECFDDQNEYDIDSNTDIDKANSCHAILMALKNLSSAWHGPKKTGKLWAKHLLADLEKLGMLQSLSEDEAGKQLIQCIEKMSALNQGQFSFQSWLALFDLWIDESSYLEKSLPGVAKITVLPLSGLRLRQFEAVVMVGCDDKQLPSFSDAGLFFSEQLMSALSIKGVQEEFIQQSRDLSQLLVTHQYVSLIWQTQGSGQSENGLSPWLVRLEKNLKLATHSTSLLPMSEATEINMPQSQVSWDINQYPMPTSVSPSAYKLLRDCPYRFYVNRLLGLRPLEGLEVESDNSLIGKLLHRVLRNFYQAIRTKDLQEALNLSSLSAEDRSLRYQWLIQLLESISEKAFLRIIQGNGRYIAYWQDWRNQIPSWVDWQLGREAAGWQFHDAEVKVGFDLMLDNEVMVRIEGYVDRFDVHPKLGASVIDYKFQSADKIKKKSAYIADDPQLLIYAKAVNQSMVVDEKNVSTVEWVALKQDKKKLDKGQPHFEYPLENFKEHYDHFVGDISRDLNAVWAGRPMKASAPDGVCQYCEVRGICRKGMWSDVQ
jgi:ATP-dependent helicase/nuclease subunit B